VLEHFTKDDGEKFIEECFRVLKPGGIVRIAIPNLEIIVRNYLACFEEGLKHPNDEMVRANYDWMVLEMYDQTVRDHIGGNMGKYLFQDVIKNEQFVFERLGEEAKTIRKAFFNSQENISTVPSLLIKTVGIKSVILKLKSTLKRLFIKKLKVDEKAMLVGKFRASGEIHQWMYDRYSLCALLKDKGGANMIVRDAFTSYINNWSDYNIDAKAGFVRKPDSLFMEAIK
jgi:SAM-dependent methyltransferase